MSVVAGSPGVMKLASSRPRPSCADSAAAPKTSAFVETTLGVEDRRWPPAQIHRSLVSWRAGHPVNAGEPVVLLAGSAASRSRPLIAAQRLGTDPHHGVGAPSERPGWHARSGMAR